ncbi:MAG: glycosyltransferase family 2 protein [Pseudomonadota bacterium]
MSYRLSICIPTLNRGAYIGETLDSIVSQWEPGVEVVIVDGGSTDNTEQVVADYSARFPDIRFFKKDKATKGPSNEGFDRDCDQAVVLASGEYCWLMTDDDLLKPGALKIILAQTDRNYSLIVVNAEVMNSDFTQKLVARRPNIPHDRVFTAGEWELFAQTAVSHLTFVGAVIIRRYLWLGRNRQKYFGSGFIHVGVIFDEPVSGSLLIMAEPLVSIRFGNAQWSSRAFQIWMLNWPSLVWSFPSLANSTKEAICPREPWRSLKTLLFNRAMGTYSVTEYRNFVEKQPGGALTKVVSKLISRIPRTLLYIPVLFYIRLAVPDSNYVLFNLRESWKNK